MPRALMLSAALLAAAAPAFAAQPVMQQESSADERDPEAMAALDRMGAALRRLQYFNLHADLTTEDVLASGQKLQFGGSVDIVTRRPNRMRLALKLGEGERQLYYDGKTATLFAPGPKYYAVFDAPPTVRETVELAAERYGIEIPLADMFSWGEDPELTKRVESAFYAGKEMIGGHMCEHYAVRQALVDWQLWIRESADALPCKLVITATYDASMPQYTAVYSWNLDSPAADDAFAFKPPEGAQQIQFDLGKGLAAVSEK